MVVKTGKEAVAVQSRPATSFSWMPDARMDGFEATSIIRDAGIGGGHTPIIALTAHAMAGTANAV